MKVQKITLSETSKERWIVLDDDFRPVEPIVTFLRHLDNIERSPQTIRAYAYHLRAFWEFLNSFGKDWTRIGPRDLAECVAWLRNPASGTVTPMEGSEPARSEATVNAVLSAVVAFHEFHARLGNAAEVSWHGVGKGSGGRFKSFLHGIGKTRPGRSRVVGLRKRTETVKTVTSEEVERLTAACRTLRDKFLICLLYETGMRIGQALGLRHADVRPRDGVIWIEPRADNVNSARAKTREAYPIDVSEGLTDLYVEYLAQEYGYIDSDYVFVNVRRRPVGSPMTDRNVAGLFRRLRKATGITVHPHMLRHTHATELIAAGWEPHLVQRRLGHASVQTTVNTYVHLPRKALKDAFRSYEQKRKEGAS